MRASQDIQAGLIQVANDRAYVRHMRELVDRLDVALNREEAHLKRAYAIVVDGQAQHVDMAGVAITLTSKPAHRAAVLKCFKPDRKGRAPSHLSQVELARWTGIDTGALSRAVRDLEIQGALRRDGQTRRRSPIWRLP